MTKPSPEAIRAWAVSSTRASMALSREEPDMGISEEFGTNLGYEKDRADKAEAELDRAYERYDQAEKDRNHWYDKAREYRQQSVEYRESRDKWREVAVRDQLSSRDALPRVITADELREGQHFVSFWPGKSNPVVGGKITRINDDITGLGDEIWVDGRFALYAGQTESTLVLLADAPEPEPEKWDRAVTDDVIRRFNENIRLAQSTLSESWRKPPFRGTPVRPQSIRAGDLYDIHTAHGSTITGVVAVRNGVRNPQNGDIYRLVTRKA